MKVQRMTHSNKKESNEKKLSVAIKSSVKAGAPAHDPLVGGWGG